MALNKYTYTDDEQFNKQVKGATRFIAVVVVLAILAAGIAVGYAVYISQL